MLILLIPFYLPFAEIDSALAAFNLNREGIQFARLEWGNSKLVLPAVKKLMDSPLKGEEYSNRIIKALDSNVGDLIKTLACDLEISFGKMQCRITNIENLVSEINRVGKMRDEAFSTLSEREKIILLSELPGRWENEDDSTDDWLKTVLLKRYDIEFDTTNINDDTVMAIFNKVDMDKLMEAGLLLYKIAEQVPELLNDISDDSCPKIVKTDYGKVIIGTKGPDHYNGDIPFILDPGGDDRYIDCGGAIGLLDSNHSGLSLIVDLNGNDVYHSNQIISNGASLCGCAVLIDGEGNDCYYSTHYSIAAGYMGFGLLLDKGGNDFYKGGIFSVGAANFGLGLMLDYEGDDSYSTACFGEGFGSTYGYGLLADYQGSDVYYAGGRYPHTPLQPNSYQSLSQGFAMGVRPDWGGGIGFLYDKEGNDFYSGDIYAQGASYWCSAGFLVDGAGQDRYIATEYAQGSGIHLSYGYLADLCGDDHYFSRFGPSLGEGHDFSCGILIDSSGNDWYSVSGGLGVGLHNSFGLFCDISGNDVYNITEDLGIGDANYGRGFSGIGIFLDLQGKDQYPEGRGYDDITWFNRGYGIGIDKESKVEAEDLPQRSVPDFSEMGVDEIFSIASEWGVGDNKDRVREARDYFSKKGKIALDYICQNKLDTKNGLELRAIEKAFKENKDSLTPYLASKLNDTNEKIRKNVFYFIGKLKVELLSDSLLVSLSRQDNKNILRYIVYALGKVKEEKSVGKIIGFLREKEPLKITSIRALGEIGDTAAIEPILKQMKNPSVTVRSSIEQSLVSYDTLLYPFIEKQLNGNFYPELLLTLAKAVEADSSNYRRKVKRLLFKYLEDTDWKRREYAARGLKLLGGEDVIERFKLLVDCEPNPFVRGVLK